MTFLDSHSKMNHFTTICRKNKYLNASVIRRIYIQWASISQYLLVAVVTFEGMGGSGETCTLS